MTKTFTLLALLAIGLAACGGDDLSSSDTTSAPTGETTTPLAAPDEAEVLLDVRDEGGFVPVEYNLTRVPLYVVMTDGTIHSQGPMTLEYPGKALPNLRTTKVDAAGLEELRQMVAEMGLAELTDERNQQAMEVIADAADTVVTLYDDEGAHTYGVYALGFPDVTIDDPRAALLEDLVATLDRLVADGEDAGAYQPERVEMFAREVQPGADAEFANTAPWPASVTFDEMSEGQVEYRCSLLEGRAATEFMSAMADANQATTFDLDGTEYTVLAHPLFPHEDPTCA